MQVVHSCCAGLDVHKKSVYACVVKFGDDGRKQQQVRSFTTMTKDLLALGDWLKQSAVTHVAMGSNGRVLASGVGAVLDGQFELLLVNPQHMKAVPARKNDVRDCEWIADLLQHGLLRGSFVPPVEIQDLRDLTRYRVELTQAQSRVSNRIQKLLEQANIKLGSIASDMLGPSGRRMIDAIIAGEDGPQRLAELAQRALRKKIPIFRRSRERQLWRGRTMSQCGCYVKPSRPRPVRRAPGERDAAQALRSDSAVAERGDPPERGTFAVGRREFPSLVATKPVVDWAGEADARRMTSTEQIVWAHPGDKGLKPADLKPGTMLRVYADLLPASDGPAVRDPHVQPDHRRQHDLPTSGRHRERSLRLHRRRGGREADRHRPRVHAAARHRETLLRDARATGSSTSISPSRGS